MIMKQGNPTKASGIRAFPWKLTAGIAIGGGLGFLYYYFVGCASGACPITSNPYMSVLYGAVMGALVARM